MTELVRCALENGLRELTITDHCDLLSMEGTITLDFDWAPLRTQFLEAKELAGDRLRLNYGIELGGASDFPEAADLILRENTDFVLGSVHNLSVSAGCTDFYDLDYRNNPELCRSALEDYFASMERLAAWNGFDSLAHLPYLLRYLRDRDGMPITLDPWEGRIRAILRTLIRNGKALELNTCRGKSVEDYRGLLRWYRQEGGALVTLGSDAHDPRDVGKGLREAQLLLKEEGFRSFAIYHKHIPTEIPLD